jgi:hypothetical protein
MRFVHLHQTELHLAARLSNGLLQCYGCRFADCMWIRSVEWQQQLHDQLCSVQITALGCPPEEDVESYVRFIGSYMYDFARVSRRLEDLQKVIQHLYPVYLQPVRDGKIERDNATALFAAFAPHFREAVANFTSGAAAASFVPKQHKPRYLANSCLLRPYRQLQ